MIKIGARGSKLSKRQVKEVMDEVDVDYVCEWIETQGDRDLISSLKPMDKTDFFTRELDEKVLSGNCDIAIHSAKDLPDPLPIRLQIVALTQGVDPRDSLLLRDGETLKNLKTGALIGSSSIRRDQMIHQLRPDLICKEVRGPVDQRIVQLEQGKIDGLVVAEAALIRLGLTDKNRILLKGATPPFQGKLAVVAREGNVAMERLFKEIDTRGRILYLGTEKKKGMVHFPVIEIIPRDFKSREIREGLEDFPQFTHVILTSKNSVQIFCDCLDFYGYSLKGKKVIAIGKVTAHALEKRRVRVTHIAQDESQEGVIELLNGEDLKGAYLLLPQSSEARLSLATYLERCFVHYRRIIMYETRSKRPKEIPDLKNFDEIIFTSPSIVKAFTKIFHEIPPGIQLTPIGPITSKALAKTKFKVY